jgi:PAS domain S-box-containing protein
MLALMYLFSTWLNWQGHFNLARTFLILFASLSVFMVSSMQGRGSGNNLLYLPIICGIFVLFNPKEKTPMLFHVGIPLLCLIILELTDYSLLLLPHISSQTSPFLINFIICVVAFWLCIDFLVRTNVEIEEALKESEMDLTAVIENTQDSIWSVDREGYLLTLNSSFRREFQRFSGIELKKGDRILDHLQEAEQKIWSELYERALKGERIVKNLQYHYDHISVDTEVSVNPIKDSTGLITGISFFSKDMTERNQATEEISQKSNLLRMLLEKMPVLFYRIAPDGTILESLGAGLKTLGLRENETAGKNFYQIYPDLYPQLMASASQTSTVIEYTGETNGEVWHFDKYIFADSEGGYICFGRDITDKKRDVETIRQNNAELTTIMESTQSSIFALDQHLRYIVFNTRHEATMNKLYRVEIEQGLSIIDLQKEILDPEFDRLISNIRRALAGEQLSLIQEYGNTALYRAFFETSFTPIRNEENQINGVAIFSQDISDRKKSEDELRRINFELDSFVYRSSHDLRAPLRSLLGLTNLVRMENSPEERALYLGLIDKSVNKLDTFIADMTNFSRNSRQILNIEEVEFDSIIKDCAENLRYMDNADRVALRTQLRIDSPFYSDSLRINTVLQNLLSNSVKYQRLHIHDAYVQIDIHCDSQRAMIVYTDNGKGIEAQYLNRIFEMFFRASADSYGSGLGLYIVKQVVEKLQGDIKVESRLGEGTTFTVIIPNLKSMLERKEGIKEEQV